MAYQAKCEKCKVKYEWDREYSLRKGLKCPVCGSFLEQTSYQKRWPIKKDPPIMDYDGAQK